MDSHKNDEINSVRLLLLLEKEDICVCVCVYRVVTAMHIDRNNIDLSQNHRRLQKYTFRICNWTNCYVSFVVLSNLCMWMWTPQFPHDRESTRSYVSYLLQLRCHMRSCMRCMHVMYVGVLYTYSVHLYMYIILICFVSYNRDTCTHTHTQHTQS